MSNDNRPADGSYEQLCTDLTDAIKRGRTAGLRPLTIWNVVDSLREELDRTVWSGGDNDRC
jgi:hypothetical protein